MIKDWKTTLAALIFLGATVSMILGWIDNQEYAAILGAAGTYGFLIASDSKKEG